MSVASVRRDRRIGELYYNGAWIVQMRLYSPTMGRMRREPA